MSPISLTRRILLPVLVMACLGGCGERNSRNVFSSDSGGTHLAGWLPGGHTAAARSDIDSCCECHGTDFTGGISKTACTRCHLGDQSHVHPLAWGDLAFVRHSGYVGLNGISTCANTYCHGINLTGTGNSGPSCTSCHIGGPLAVHPNTIAWLNRTSQGFHGEYVKNNGTGSCANATCHGENLEGVSASGLACMGCHSSSTYSRYGSGGT
jgi:hypothetical protein